MPNFLDFEKPVAELEGGTVEPPPVWRGRPVKEANVV